MEILDLCNVSFSYNRSEFIKGLSVSIGSGEFVALLGANGSGKSTILKLSAGILKPRSGEINLWGKPLHLYHGKERAKLISYLPQMLDINLPFTVKELVNMGRYPYDIPPDLSLEEAMEMVGLIEKADSLVTELSGGERRRVFIAMTLLQGAGILLLDEPLANLDIKYQIELIRLLKGLRDKKGISIIMALHDINMAFYFEKVLLVKSGKMLGMGSPESVFKGDILKEVFDINIEIRRQDSGELFISHKNNFLL
ncbi:MAG: ABC transporter ATP-binding protein [Nitrospinae bacterium]|nr:ABC transporter ATP-binding protein [Nitrospinota bacterium]